MNFRIAVRLTIAVALATAGAVAQAQGPGNQGSEPQLELVPRFDRDGNGRLNREERRAARPVAAQAAQNRMQPRAFAGEPRPGRRLAPADVGPYPRTPFYDLGTLRTIFLEFEAADWEQELADFFNTDVEVAATMTVDGRTYRDVGVGFRGGSSFLFVPSGLKRSFNISVDFANQGQNLHGYRTLNLLNANNDPTFLRAVLYTEISRRYVPTPLMNYVRVVINGESWGVYVNAQQFNTDFLRDSFKETRGARWKVPGNRFGGAALAYLGNDVAAYRGRYEIRSRDNEESWRALIEFTRVLNDTPADKLEAALRPILNIDGALRFLAVEMALVNSDGYWARASDFNLYRDPSGRFHVIPHDVNEAFGAERRSPQTDPLSAIDDTKPLRAKLLAVPALRERYLGYVREIAQKWLDWNALLPILEPAHRLIAPEVEVDTRKLYDWAGFKAGIAAADNPLKTFIDARRAYLLSYQAR